MVSFSIQKYRGFTLGIPDMNIKLEKDEDYGYDEHADCPRCMFLRQQIIDDRWL